MFIQLAILLIIIIIVAFVMFLICKTKADELFPDTDMESIAGHETQKKKSLNERNQIFYLFIHLFEI